MPDPAVLFIALLLIVWILSWFFSYFDFGLTDPRNGEPLLVINQLSGASMTAFFSAMVTNFAHFHPIGVVLVAMLGIGVAEHTEVAVDADILDADAAEVEFVEAAVDAVAVGAEAGALEQEVVADLADAVVGAGAEVIVSTVDVVDTEAVGAETLPLGGHAAAVEVE